MKLIINTSLCLLLLLGALNANAKDQSDSVRFFNTLQLSVGDFHVQHKAHTKQHFFAGYFPVTQYGISFQRRLTNHWGVGFDFMKWQAWKLISALQRMGTIEVPIDSYVPVIGQLEARTSYKMFDLYISYQIYITHKDYISVFSGGSYCYGVNWYLKTYFQNPVPQGDIQASYETRDARYWGVVPGIKYEHLFCKNRLSVGIDLRGRYYSGRPEAEYNYSVLAGFHF